MPVRTIRAPHPIDLARSLRPLRRGAGDPTMRIRPGEVVRSMRTPEGPAALRLRQIGDAIEVEGAGEGAAWALDRADALAGALDDDRGFTPRHPAVGEAWRRHRGVRIVAAGAVIDLLVPTVLEQKVTGAEARRAYREMARALGEPAPGGLDLLLPPDPARIAELPYFAFHPWGVERRRADTLRRICARASRIEALAGLDPAAARTELQRLPGVGPWTAAEVTRLALGDADAVSVGDFHLPHLVAWALAGEPRGTDERMLELLAPYEGQRGRVQRLLEVSGPSAPRFGPRMPVRSIRAR
jgi:3-methyladenine DNA glycosylase/8-oxoguanine DNA glycosylase